MSTAQQVRANSTPPRIGGKPIPTIPSIVEVDPNTAAAWLQRNSHNRSLRNEAVNAMARDMANGRWQYTGEAIKFSVDGTLLDGQHRLAAVVRAQATLPILVVPGLPGTAQDVMDAGARRTAGDALSLRDETHANQLAAAARLAILYERGTLSGGKGGMVTHAEILGWIGTNPDIREATAATASGDLKSIPLPGSMLAFSLWRLRRVDRPAADEFFADLAAMRTVGRGDPRAALLQRLNSAKASRERLTRAAQLALIFRAWNAIRRGQPVTILKIAFNGGAVDIPQPV